MTEWKCTTRQPLLRCSFPLALLRSANIVSGHTTDIHVIVPFTIGHCDLFDRPGDHKTQLLREWLGLAITDTVLMTASILLSTCRYILQVQQPGNLTFVRLALRYKQICLQTLREEMNSLSASASVTVMTVAKALALALDEVV